MVPDQTAPKWVHTGSTLFAERTYNHKQTTKQTTIVVIGSLRVNICDGRTFYMLR